MFSKPEHKSLQQLYKPNQSLSVKFYDVRTFGCVENCQVRTVSGTLTLTGTAYSRPALIQISSAPSTYWMFNMLDTRTTGAHITLQTANNHNQPMVTGVASIKKCHI